MRLTAELKQKLLNKGGEFETAYDKQLYFAFLYADLSEAKSAQASEIEAQIAKLTKEYQRLLRESQEYATKFEEQYTLLSSKE